MYRIALLVVGAIVLVLVGVLAYQKLTEEPLERYLALRNLELLDELEAAWKAHEERPWDPDLALDDPLHFSPLRDDLLTIDLHDACDEVKSIHARYLKVTEEAPKLLAELMLGPPEEERAPGTTLRPANAEWVVDIRNAGIRIELLTRDIDKEMGELRVKYRRIVKPRR